MKYIIAIFTALALSLSAFAGGHHGHGVTSASAGSYAGTIGGSVAVSGGAYGSGGGAATYSESGAYNESGAGACTGGCGGVNTYAFTDGGSYGTTETETYGNGFGLSGSISGYEGYGAANGSTHGFGH